MTNYHFNFAIVWRYSGKLFEGLLLSIELAAATIAIGMLIGLTLAIIQMDGPKWARPFITAYVEFIRNVPLLLLVYLVFYGIPSAIDLQYDAVTSFVATLSIYSGAYLVEVLRAGLEAVPRGLVEAGKAIGLTPEACCCMCACPRLSASPCPRSRTPMSRCSRTPRSPRHRGSRTRLWHALDRDADLPHGRGLSPGHADLSRHQLRHPAAASAGRAALRDCKVRR
jgi:His/Glu/Gln/Arg/opine family amino acid ABC transporter permease subunit